MHVDVQPRLTAWDIVHTDGAPRAGRALAQNGMLSGALHTLGYFSTDVCLGSPPRRYDLIVDTGSSLTAVPCTKCRHCGQHVCGESGRFDPAASPTAKIIGCSESVPGLRCDSCSHASGSRCGYAVSYTEGSAIRGDIVSDVVHFKSAPSAATGANVSVRGYFGCQSYESGMFQRQRADGIMGLQVAHRRGKVPSFLSALVDQLGANKTFSLCLSDSSGLFLLGGKPPSSESAYRAPPLTLPLARGARALFTLRLMGIVTAKVPKLTGGGGAPSPVNASQLRYVPLKGVATPMLNPAIVDSGTTFVYASTPVYRAMLSAIRADLPNPERGARLCAYLHDWELASLPRFGLIFESSVRQLYVSPRQYMVEFPRGGGATHARGRHYCAAIFDNQRGGTVIGASVLRDREVIFDVGRATITFVDSNCSAATPQNSHLRDAYIFNGCPRAGGGASTARDAPNRRVAMPASRAHVKHLTAANSRARMAIAFNKFKRAANSGFKALRRRAARAGKAS